MRGNVSLKGVERLIESEQVRGMSPELSTVLIVVGILSDVEDPRTQVGGDDRRDQLEGIRKGTGRVIDARLIRADRVSNQARMRKPIGARLGGEIPVPGTDRG